MTSMNEKDYYKILGVSEDADISEIRRSFQKKARTMHPDVNKEPDAEEKFKELSEAYAVLSDKDKRARYDAMRSGNPFMTTGGGSPFTSSPMAADSWPFSGFGGPFEGFTNMYTGVSQNYSYRPEAGADLVIEAVLDAQTAKEGVKRGFTYNRFVTCEACHGSGSLHRSEPVTCPTCHGTGRLTINLESLFGLGEISVPCPECQGTGKVVEDPCQVCHGSGRHLEASEIVIDIPAGVHDGESIRMEGMGNAGTNNSPAGDFVLKIAVPSERITYKQRSGLSLMGVITPFIILGALNSALTATLFLVIPVMIVGIALLFPLDIKGKNRIWWSNAARAYFSGFFNGLILALFMFAMVSCAGGLGTAGVAGHHGTVATILK